MPAIQWQLQHVHAKFIWIAYDKPVYVYASGVNIVLLAVSRHTKSILFALHCLISTTLFILSQAIFAESLTPIFEASYKSRYSGFSIEVKRTLVQLSAEDYELKSVAKSLIGSIKERSVFSMTNGHYLAKNYQYQRSIFGKKSERYIDFDWANNTGTYRRKDKPEKDGNFKLKDGILDPNLYQLKVQNALFLGAQRIPIAYARDSRVKTMTLSVGEKTHYTLGKKKYDAIVINRDPEDGSKKHTEIIVIPELAYQIARITHTDEDGDTHSTKLHHFKANYRRLRDFYSIDRM